jgi:mediator of RNA polymerase II transcription subunit 31
MNLPDKTRFQVELEFVQSLSNPNYLQFLAQQQYFEDEDFLLFIEYLKYWKEPEYCKYIVYPYCLEILDLLAEPEFRQSIQTTDRVTFIHHKVFYSR